MQTLPAQEVKRRGLAAIEELLEQGPVHILKHNRPACVVLSEAEFARLSQPDTSRNSLTSAWDALLAPTRQGTVSRTEVDRHLADERNSWE